MEKWKGIVYVLMGAASYGVLATFVRLANIEGLHTGELNFLQYFVGFLALLLLSFTNKSNKEETNTKEYKNSKRKLLIFGIPTGLTSCFYYLTIQYVPVSIAIILLMQAIWMGVVLELIITRKVHKLKLIGSLFVIIGTTFAVDVFHQFHILNPLGLLFGILASIAYTGSLYASNSIATHLPNIIRSKYFVLGGLIVVFLFWNTQLFQITEFTSLSLWNYGIFLGLFGAIIPMYCFNKGFPITGIGLGSILTSFEIPVSIFSAHFFLQEEVQTIQWIGVGIIIGSVALINYKSNS